jgi:hypothetical protein
MEKQVIYGRDKRDPGLPIKEILKWPESNNPVIQNRPVSGKWLSETRDSFKGFLDPPKSIIEAIPVPVEVDSLPLEPVSIPSNLIQKTKKPVKNPRPESRSLSNSAFSALFKKPVFAQYGQGNSTIGKKRLFGKGHMKTFNVIPLSTNSHFVQNGAKMKSFVVNKKKSESKIEAAPEKKEVLVNLVKEDVEKNGNNTVKVESATQSVQYDGEICKRCCSEFDPKVEDSLRRDNFSLKNPREYKGDDPRKTGLIPFAGVSKKKSERAYEVIFG